jgi:hypothetical protein
MHTLGAVPELDDEGVLDAVLETVGILEGELEGRA